MLTRVHEERHVPDYPWNLRSFSIVSPLFDEVDRLALEYLTNGNRFTDQWLLVKCTLSAHPSVRLFPQVFHEFRWG